MYIFADASLQLEPSAPMEGASLESALSPTAPMLSDTSLEAGEFNFDQSYNEILKLNEETSEEVGKRCKFNVLQEQKYLLTLLFRNKVYWPP